MKKIIKLKESDLENIVKRVLAEQGEVEMDMDMEVEDEEEGDAIEITLDHIAMLKTKTKTKINKNPSNREFFLLLWIKVTLIRY
jgi:hypothetical protein